MLNLFEYTLGNMMTKQKSITSLFPTFYDRVGKVADNGGVKLFRMKPGLWTFKVTSGTTPGVRYNDYVKFIDPEKTLRRLVHDKNNWKTDKSGIDYRKLAVEFLFRSDLKVNCSCPADLYYGGQNIRTKKNAKYTKPEHRPPKQKNPQEYGVGCKHLQLVMDTLPFYGGKMATYLKKYYSQDIAKYEAEIKGERDMFKKAGSALGQRLGKEKPTSKEPEAPKKDEVEPGFTDFSQEGPETTQEESITRKEEALIEGVLCYGK